MKEIIAEALIISNEEQNEQISSGASKFGKNVDWARYYLAEAGFIDRSVRGVWSLTESGRHVSLNQDQAVSLFQEIHKKYSEIRKKSRKTKIKNDEFIDENVDYREQLMNKLISLSPQGFERLCQRLLRESGFEHVTVTGRSGDGGLDGVGILEVNPFVSFKVLFQCKRYSGSVSPSQVRDFRGAMAGRADKGIILTTGTFTTEAKKEAIRDGVDPIDIVDGEKLIDMFEALELGLKPVITFELDEKFFTDFE